MKTTVSHRINIKGDDNVLQVIKRHLKESILFGNEENRPKGGIFVTTKPNTVRVDLVLLNTLFAEYLKDDNKARGQVNINIQHEDQERLEKLSRIITEVMDKGYREGYSFNVIGDILVLRLSRTLHMRNIRTSFEKENYTIGE